MKRPRVKRVHNPERLPGDRIRIGTAQVGVGAEIDDDAVGTTWRLLGLMDGTRDFRQIADELRRHSPGLEDSRIRQAIDKLSGAGFVEEADAAPPDLTPGELARYESNRHYFAWVDISPRGSPYAHQERLKDSRVTVLGLGGTGSAASMSLAAAGVGHLHCADGDVVEESNLSRQLVFSEADIGRSKAEAAVARLQSLNSCVEITGEQMSAGGVGDIASLMRDRDLFILCADKPAGHIQRWVNEAALITGTPWILSAYVGPMAVVGTFVPVRTPCFVCLAEHEARHGNRDEQVGGFLFPVDALNATVAPAANLSGHLAALEAIYFLTDLRPQTIGRIFHQNLIMYEHSYYTEAPLLRDCPACGPHVNATAIPGSAPS